MSEKKDASPGIRWDRSRLELLDQRRLPAEMHYLVCANADEVAAAIRGMVVRGAPAIAIAAAYGMALAARGEENRLGESRRKALIAARETLARARPTAVNLAHALERFDPLIECGAATGEFTALAEALHAGDIAINRRLAEAGSTRIAPGSRILTHCNTGALATGGVGTAFGVIAAAWRAGRLAEVRFTETRPWLQGARLNAWEFARAGIPATLMTEAAAAGRALAGGFDWLIVGADRIAANGDVVNKVGTAPLAVLTRRGGGRVMVVAPFATVDPELASGQKLGVEQRDAAEVWAATGVKNLPVGIDVANPVFDVTPAAEVDLLVTERGTVSPTRSERPDALVQPFSC
ncbi:MAG: S-methyl-5-thioribose-1-phosphate isomerase [Gammaproteobacteria bacterium]